MANLLEEREFSKVQMGMDPERQRAVACKFLMYVPAATQVLGVTNLCK